MVPYIWDTMCIVCNILHTRSDCMETKRRFLAFYIDSCISHNHHAGTRYSRKTFLFTYSDIATIQFYSKYIMNRYVPKELTKKDKKKQLTMINKSKRLYKKHQYYTRSKVNSFKSKPSKHVAKAMKMYQVDHVVPNEELSQKTGCSVSALKQIIKKGEGAYYSSGSRPNQTAQSWATARLASAITGGKASKVDYHILKGCNHNKKAFRLAQ